MFIRKNIFNYKFWKIPDGYFIRKLNALLQEGGEYGVNTAPEGPISRR